ncbi:MAG: methylmalonyl-CoA mutase family protein, partial [Candidatus Eiseniibacteriota bacterium]
MASQEPGSTRTTARGREPAGATRERLFAAFEPASHEAWRAEAERLLRGAPFDRRMRTRTVEGITLEPIYHREDLAGLAAVGSMPGETPFLRGASVLGNRAGGWRIAQELDRRLDGTATGAATEAATGAATGTPAGSATPNAALRAALARGQNAIWVGSDALDSLLEDIDPAAQPLFIRARAGDGAAACELLETVARRHGIDLATLDGAIVLDPLGALAASGSLARSLDACFADLAATTVWAARHTPRLGSVWVDGTPYHDGGGSAVEELAFTIATGIESLRRLETHGVEIETAAAHLRAG